MVLIFLMVRLQVLCSRIGLIEGMQSAVAGMPVLRHDVDEVARLTTRNVPTFALGHSPS